MIVRTPAREHSATASATPGRTGSRRPTSPSSSKSKSCWSAGSVPSPIMRPRATASTRWPSAVASSTWRVSSCQPAGRRDGTGPRSPRARPWPRSGDGIRPASARHATAPGAASDSGYSRTSSQSGCSCSVPGSRSSPRSTKALSIGIERVRPGEASTAVLDERVELARAAAGRRARVRRPSTMSSTMRMLFRVRVPVLSTQTTVADPERLDDRRAPGEHVLVRHPPRAERHEDGEDDRELLREQRHRGRDAGEQALEPVAPRQAVDDDDGGGGADAEHRDDRARCGRSRAAAGSSRSRSTAARCRSCPSSVCPPVRCTTRDAVALDDERAREHPRRRVAARTAHRERCRPPLLDLRTGTDSPVRADSSTYT